jgi:hypothetical protein
MTAATATTEKKDVLRDKRAQGIAAMGLVKREGDRFRVTTPTLRGRRSSYEVWRDDAGRVRCSCLEFEEQVAEQPNFRCEHILAVKHALVAKNSEAVVKQPVPAPAAGAEPTAPATPNTTTQSASEKPARTKRDAASALVQQSGFEREPEETVAEPTKLNLVEPAASESLSAHDNDEEQIMKRQAKEDELPLNAIDHEADESEAQKAPIVPLALAGTANFTSTLRSLRQPMDPKLVKTREGWTDRAGNTHMVEYVEWHAVADLLDRLTPTWSHSVRNIVQIGETVAVTAAITIDGVTREGVGTGTADNETGIKKAEHDALKRAAIKFGIARDLYQRESEVIEKQGGGPQAGDFPRDPLAKSMADLVTPKQLGMIRALGREANVDVDQECQSVLRCKTDELSKRAASSFIEHLKGMQQEVAANSPMRRAS